MWISYALGQVNIFEKLANRWQELADTVAERNSDDPDIKTYTESAKLAKARAKFWRGKIRIDNAVCFSDTGR